MPYVTMTQVRVNEQGEGEEIPVHSDKYLKRLKNRDAARLRQQIKQARRNAKRKPLLMKGLGHTVDPTGIALDMQNQPLPAPARAVATPVQARDATLSEPQIVPIRIVYIYEDENGNVFEEPAKPRATPKPAYKKKFF